MIKDYFKFAITSITHRRLRSWLTILGIIIGIAAIVALVSISNGMEHAIKEQFEKFGTDTISIMPKNFRGPGTGSAELDNSDVKVLKSIPELKYVFPAVYGNAEVEFHNEKAYLYIMGVDLSSKAASVWEEAGFEVEKGRFPENEENNAVGLGYLVSTDIFKDEIHIKNRIKINGKNYKVVGIAKSIGNQQDDTSIYMNIDTAKEILNQENYNFIMAIAKEGVNVDDTSDKIYRKLKNHRNDENFQVMTLKEVMEQIQSILKIIQLVLVGIAAISLIVGAVGIMNTMYTSVLERTREIGIMKAIGASNHSIMLVFLIESAIIGLIGGIIGAGIGTVIAQGVKAASSSFALPLPLKIIIEWKLIAFSISFAVAIGALSGLLPARKAAKSKPADSLRYE